jgi:TonB family protein
VASAVLSGGSVAAGIATGSGVAGGLTALVNFMSMTKVQLGLSGALAAAGATGFMVQADTNARLRDEMAALRATSAAVADLQAENQRLARQAAEVQEMRGDDGRFERLQQEAVTLRGRLEQLAQAEAARAASRAAARNVYDISQLDRTPSPRFQARPQYPVEMRQAGISGEVVVEFVVDREGAVTNAFALRSSRPEFEAAAVAAVSSWKFRPGQKGGQEVDTRLQIPIVFTLSESEGKSGNMKVTALPATPGATSTAEPPFVVQHSGPAGASATTSPR